MNKKTNQKGFTIVEVMIGAAIVLVLGAGIAGLQKMITDSQVFVIRNYLNLDEANDNVKAIALQLRTARQGDNGAYWLDEANDNEISFYTDLDFDGSAEKVRYWRQDSNFYKQIIKPEGFPVQYLTAGNPVVLSENVTNGDSPIFYYYNGNWPQDTINNPLPDSLRLSGTKLIKIYLMVKSDQQQDDFIIESFAQVRTRKDNL